MDVDDDRLAWVYLVERVGLVSYRNVKNLVLVVNVGGCLS